MEQFFRDHNLFKILLILIPIYILCFSLYHLMTNNKIERNQKIVWVLVIFLFNIIGSIIYLLIHNRKIKIN
ncbi:PLD nuclease N-terminal domain-containing protein [Sphingobacterium sp. 1.A.5]|uniref:PLD nuclease N-terminal domain-containing protein n=1 Tax=Sphingobacterium sp. 1.A.5 TaxID=2044604 RepID=UPI000C0BFF29